MSTSRSGGPLSAPPPPRLRLLRSYDESLSPPPACATPAKRRAPSTRFGAAAAVAAAAKAEGRGKAQEAGRGNAAARQGVAAERGRDGGGGGGGSGSSGGSSRRRRDALGDLCSNLTPRFDDALGRGGFSPQAAVGGVGAWSDDEGDVQHRGGRPPLAMLAVPVALPAVPPLGDAVYAANGGSDAAAAAASASGVAVKAVAVTPAKDTLIVASPASARALSSMKTKPAFAAGCGNGSDDSVGRRELPSLAAVSHLALLGVQVAAAAERTTAAAAATSTALPAATPTAADAPTAAAATAAARAAAAAGADAETVVASAAAAAAAAAASPAEDFAAKWGFDIKSGMPSARREGAGAKWNWTVV
ncbi:hypothetical protein MMPV_007519 [Pyropia vietnamensis]